MLRRERGAAGLAHRVARGRRRGGVGRALLGAALADPAATEAAAEDTMESHQVTGRIRDYYK